MKRKPLIHLTLVHEQIRPQAMLIEVLSYGRARGDDLALGKVVPEGVQLLHQLGHRILRLIGHQAKG